MQIVGTQIQPKTSRYVVRPGITGMGMHDHLGMTAGRAGKVKHRGIIRQRRHISVLIAGFLDFRVIVNPYFSIIYYYNILCNYRNFFYATITVICFF